MDKRIATGVRNSLDAMRTALEELARGEGFVTTAEAVTICPFCVSEESLLAYPEFVLPRFAKNPRAKRKTYLWDPRDLQALPWVLKRWERAIAEGPEAEAEFERQRWRELTQRDMSAMEDVNQKEAA